MIALPSIMLCIESRAFKIPHRGPDSFYSLAGAAITVWNTFTDSARQCGVNGVDADELPRLSRWVADHGGRDLLDVWELLVLNSTHSTLAPVVDDDHPADTWHADQIYHVPGGVLIGWTPCMECSSCGGDGHFAPPGEEPKLDDECDDCDGTGSVYGAQVLTDIDGQVVHDELLEAA